MIEIMVVAYGSMGERARKAPSPFVVEEGATIEELMALLEIKSNELMYPLANGKRVDPKYIIEQGDEITLLPPLAGG